MCEEKLLLTLKYEIVTGNDPLDGGTFNKRETKPLPQQHTTPCIFGPTPVGPPFIRVEECGIIGNVSVLVQEEVGIIVLSHVLLNPNQSDA